MNLLPLRKYKCCKCAIAGMILILGHFAAIGQQPYWQQNVRYKIEVSLNDTQHTLDGFIQIQYTNNAPDTLSFLWFHLWPNAFKNDRTAFSEQLLLNGRTDFYFSKAEDRGYINQLNFTAGQRTLKVEDHPQHQDIIKVILSEPLLPGKTITLQTPFHVKLPKNFSRGGHIDQQYQVTQWYPKPAVYDAKGWHTMPYLDQGEFYSEFGSYDVKITLPENYVVAATGDLQTPTEQSWLFARKSYKEPAVEKTTKGPQTKMALSPKIPSSKKTKTLHYYQDSIHDFAWFANKSWTVQTDSILLANGQNVRIQTFYNPAHTSIWKNSAAMAKKAIGFRSDLLGPYPYNTVSVVEAPMAVDGGMEYPTITSIHPMKNAAQLEMIIEHEIGHNWCYGILASNERNDPWMDEGLNTYIGDRYAQLHPSIISEKENLLEERILQTLYATKKDQPIQTPSERFTELNYNLIAYKKTAAWFNMLEKKFGKEKLDEGLKLYYERWKFKHPQPDDLLNALNEKLGPDFETYKPLLASKGPLQKATSNTSIPFMQWQPLQNPLKPHRIGMLPTPAFNNYDGFQLGVTVHNYDLPPKDLQFAITPLFGFRSKNLNGLGHVAYTQRNTKRVDHITYKLQFMHFAGNAGTDSNLHYVTTPFQKWVPSVRWTFKKEPLDQTDTWLEWKTYLIREKSFIYAIRSQDSLYYPAATPWNLRYLNQLTWQHQNDRVLNPYSIRLQIQQGKEFYKASLTGNYYLNYAKGGGLSARLFAAKFGYIGKVTSAKYFNTFIYQPKLTAARGSEDYTYDNYFIGRNDASGLASQQIQYRDGGLKIRTDMFQDLQGRSDQWIAAINLTSSIPSNIIPSNIPLQLFLDLGTYAEAWDPNAINSKFLYVGGLQMNILRSAIRIYLPLVYSKTFADNLKTVPEENKLFRKISFSVDLSSIADQRMIKKILGQ